MKEILAIIPARGGSKRVPKKNVREVAGKPLIAWSIDAAKESESVTRIIISTDDEEIAKVSERSGGEVLMRPDELATDTSPTIDALLHVLDTLKEAGYEPELVILLQATTPLRKASDIDAAIKLYMKGTYESVVSVEESNPYWTFKIEEEKAVPLLGWDMFSKRSQELPKTYALNGAIYITTPENLRKNKGFLNENLGLYPMSKEESIDIDEEEDLRIAEIYLKVEE